MPSFAIRPAPRASLRRWRFVVAGALLFAAATSGATDAPRRGGLVVVAPHPDDEALVASGAIVAALGRGAAVNVLVLTNGDYDCRTKGLERQRESVEGLRALGLRAENVHFFGYPDGHLAALGETPLPPVRRLQSGRCEPGNTTYGAYGAGGAEVHRVRFGRSGRYTAGNLVDDLRAVLRTLDPETLIVTHPEDTHPDHAAAYAFVRRAVEPLRSAPRILRAFVHTDGCWPTGTGPGPSCPPGGLAPTRPTPPLSGSLEGYAPNERHPVPESCQSLDPATNPKARAIFAHRSQVRDDPASYLLAFARRDEVFFGESLVRAPGGLWATHPILGPLVRTPLGPGAPLPLEQSLPIALEVSTLRPPTNEPLRLLFLESVRGHYRWSIDGAFVTLSQTRRSERGERPLGRWSLPHDVWLHGRSAELRLELAAVPENAVVEASLFVNERFVGQAVDTAPLETGQLLALEASPSCAVRARVEQPRD